MKVDKSKKDKIKQGNQRDFDLLYDTLVNGGTYSDYRSELLDRSMPQELLDFDISEDDILAAWILGKDEESELYARGGYIHQGLNSNLYRQQFGGTWNNPHFNSTETPKVDTDLQGSANNFSNNLGAYTLIISGVADVIGNSVGAARDIDYGKYDAYLNLIGSYNPGFSTDTSFMMNGWNLMPLFDNVSYEDAGGHSGEKIAVNVGKSMLSGASAGAALGSVVPVIGTAIGAVGGALLGGISQGIGEWRNSINAKQNQDYINTIGGINAKLNPIKFGYASTLANKLGILNQLLQPYMAACGGKMKNKLASGGYINSHYDYITDPLVKVDAGGTHQENPNEGVLTSIAPDGQPNLVEEGETIINNGQNDAYVFSDRIVADDLILKSHLLPNKFAGKTYADISKELDKIIEEHKNDEISKRTFDEMISRLQQAQEDLKFQEKQEEVEKFLDGLTDEQKEQLEQTMVDEAQAEQQAAEEQAIAEQQTQELAAAEQEMPEQTPEQAPEQVAIEQPEELIVPSRYDQMMSRALFADAANQGMFGLGGHINLYGNKLAQSRYEAIKALYDLAYNNRYGGDRGYYKYPGFTDDYIQQLQAIDKFNSEDSFKLLYPDLYPYLNPEVTVPFVNTNNEQNSYTSNLFYGIEDWNSNNKLNNSIKKQSSQNNDTSNYASGIFYKPLFGTTNIESDSQENPVSDVPIRRTSVGSSSIKPRNRKTNVSQPTTPIVESQTIEAYSNPHRPDYSIFGQYIPGLTPYEIDGNLLGYTDPFGKFVPIGGEKNWDLSTGATTTKNNTNAEAKSTVIEEPEKSTNPGSTTDYSTWLRYAPVIGSGVQYLSDLFGITNRNDFSNADMFQRRINDIPNVGFVPLGNYMTYSPLDETYQLNVARSQYNAARRAIQNNASGNASAALAAINSISGNMNNTFGDLALQAREYNDKQREAVEQFNANIARINSMMSLSAQEKNQAIAAEKARLTYNLANMRENIQNMNDAAKSANENTFYNNLGAIGKENFNMQMVRTNPAFYYTIMSDGSIVYKNGFYDLNKGDLDFITADAEKAQKEQLKKNSEDALKKSEDTSSLMSSPLVGRYFSRPGFWNGYQYTGGLTNNRR